MYFSQPSIKISYCFHQLRYIFIKVALVVKNPLANAGDIRDLDLIPGLGKIPWRRAWQPTPVLLPGDSHGQRSLAGYSPQGHKELDMTEVSQHTHTHLYKTESYILELSSVIFIIYISTYLYYIIYNSTYLTVIVSKLRKCNV